MVKISTDIDLPAVIDDRLGGYRPDATIFTGQQRAGSSWLGVDHRQKIRHR
jgi:hypothetical protein